MLLKVKGGKQFYPKTIHLKLFHPHNSIRKIFHTIGVFKWLFIRSKKAFKNISFQESVKENWWFGLNASLLAGRVPYKAKLIPGLRQPIENRAMSAP